MRLLTPIVSLSIALLPVTVSLPASSDSSPPNSPLASPSNDLAARSAQNAGSNFFIDSGAETEFRGPVPDSRRWRADDAPAQEKKNCKGSGICSSTGDACKYAAERFDPSKIYFNYTSYYVTIGADIKLDSCTAIFTCDNETAYSAGMLGTHIRHGFYNLYETGRKCKRCGSSYFDNGCHVTANYCEASNCNDVNTGLALPILGP